MPRNRSDRKTVVRCIRKYIRDEFPDLKASEKIEALTDVVIEELKETMPSWAPTALLLAFMFCTSKVKSHEKEQEIKLLSSGS